MKRLFQAPAAVAVPLAMLLAAMMAALLAGCGGGAGASLPEPGPQTQSPPAPPMPGDTFTAAVLTLVRSVPESAEPSDVDATVLALPDSGEPVPVE